MKNTQPKTGLQRLFKPLVVVSLLLGICSAAQAREAQSPSDAAKLFFESIYKLDYEQAWQVLSPHSQAEIIRRIQAAEADKKLSDAQIRQWFVEADRSLKRGFWTQLRSGMDILAWHDQTFEDGPAAKNPQAQLVKVLPADVLVYAVQNNNKWYFGYIESFAERLPQKEQAAANPNAKTSPRPTPRPTTKPATKPTPKP